MPALNIDDIVQTVRRYRREADIALTDTKEKARWVWEAIQGDFNPNRNIGQVGFDAGLSLIPGLDQVMDIRDLIANIIAIVRAPSSGMAWFSLLLSLVGLIPELGSVAKGVVKLVLVKLRPLIRHADELSNASQMVKYLDEAFDAALPEILQYLRHPKVQKFLTKTGVPDVVKWVAKTVRVAAELIDTAKLKGLFNTASASLRRTLYSLESKLPTSAAQQIKTLLDGIALVQRKFDSSVEHYIEPLRAMMRRLAERLEELHWVAYSQQVNKGWIAPLSEQGARRLIKRHQPAWVKTAGKPKFEQLSPKKVYSAAWYKKGLKEGAPALGEGEIQSFAKGMRARKLVDGETLYRVVDPTSGSLSNCWVTKAVWEQITTSPNPREAWRGKLAVLPEWNQNGTYIRFKYDKARDGDITVWEGPTAMQFLDKNSTDVANGYLEGGFDQVVWHPMKRDEETKALVPDQLKNAKADSYAGGLKFEDTVLGGTQKGGIRTQINDPRIEGPHETGWGFKDFEDQHTLVGLPDPMKGQ